MIDESLDGRVTVSVIVPVYNVENYLESCLRSILEQSLECKEVILVNDGSTDASLEICEQFAGEFECVRLVSKANGGLSSARNVGLRMAKGAYVCFVDSDDVLVSDCLLDLYEACVKYGLDVLRCAYARIDECGVQTTGAGAAQAYFSKCLSGFDFLRSEVRSRAYEVVACAALFRRSHLTALSLEFVEGRTHEDHEFFLRCLLSDRDVRAMRIDRVVYGYRVRRGSITTSPSVRNIEDIIGNVGSMVTFVRGLQLNPADERLAMRAVSALYYQLTSIYGRLGGQDRIHARALIDRSLSIEMADTAFDGRQKVKLILFARARSLVELVYWLKWRGRYEQ